MDSRKVGTATLWARRDDFGLASLLSDCNLRRSCLEIERGATVLGETRPGEAGGLDPGGSEKSIPPNDWSLSMS